MLGNERHVTLSRACEKAWGLSDAIFGLAATSSNRRAKPDFELQVFFQTHQVVTFLLALTPFLGPAVDLEGNQNPGNYDNYFQSEIGEVRLDEILSQLFQHQSIIREFSEVSIVHAGIMLRQEMEFHS
jgi:hypothetical protein